MNPTVRCGQSYLNPGLIWLHTYLDNILTVTQRQRMYLLIADSIPKSKASLSSKRAQHDANSKKKGALTFRLYLIYGISGLSGGLGGFGIFIPEEFY